MTDKIPVSVLIMTKNEEANIRQCLESVSWADEIFVVDSASTDKTVEIAEKYTDKIHQFEWNGEFPKKKNWSLRNMPFNHEWVLMLDADELAPEAIAGEIQSIIADKDAHDGYVARFDCYFMGSLIRHGDPVRKLVFFKHAKTSYEKLDDTGLNERADVEVHEHQLIDGSTGFLSTRILHNDQRPLSFYFDRHNRYSSWEAYLISRKRYEEPSTDSISGKTSGGWLNMRRSLKSIFLRMPCKPLIYFIYGYFVRLGFMDGYAGFAYNICKAFYAFEISLKVREIKNSGS